MRARSAEHLRDRRRKEIAARVPRRISADEDVVRDQGAGEVGGDRRIAGGGSRAGDPVEIVEGDVLAKEEARVRRALGPHDAAGLERRVALDDHVCRALEDLEERSASAPAGSADVVEEVVADGDATSL